MPLLVSAADGNFTTAATWGLASDGTGAILTEATVGSNVTTSYVYCTAFTGTTGHVIDGIAMFLKRNTGGSGTITVALSEDNGVTATREVTINATDLPAPDNEQTWVFFKFGSTLTLDGGTDYRVGIKASVSLSATVYRNATADNWLRVLRRTTAPGSVAAGDTFLIAGEWTAAGSSTARTITMNSTAATDYGTGTATATAPTQVVTQAFTGLQIGQNGTLTWAASAATNYILRLSGNLVVWSGGTYNQGTTGTPCPRDSTMTLEFDCAADGDHGFLAMNGSTVSIQGQSRTSGKNVYWTLLNTDEAANSTSLGVADDTGWLDNDRIAVASTTRTRTECEAGTLNGAAGASTLTVDGFAGSGGGLAVAHSGTSPTQAEVILLTRNVKVQSVSSTNMTYCFFGATATADIDWCEFRYLGTNTANKRGIELASTGSTVNMQYSSVHDCETFWLYTSGTGGASVLSNNVYWNCTGGANGNIQINATGAGTFSDSIVMFAGNECLRVTTSGQALTDLRFVGGSNGGLFLVWSNSTGGTISDIVAHSNAQVGFSVSGSGTVYTVSNLTVWRNANGGAALATSRTIGTVNGIVSFGNTTSNFSVESGDVHIHDGVFNGDTTFSTSYGMSISNNVMLLRLTNCDFSTVSGIKTAHSAADIRVNAPNVTICDLSLNNCKLGATVEIDAQASMSENSAITSSKHDQTAGAYKTWKRGGTIERDTTIFNTAAPSERLTPISASVKLIGSSRLVGVDNAATKTISVYVRKSVIGDGAAYNGAEPRLILKRNDAVGITSDTVLDTASGAAGSWELLSGVTAAATDDGAFEVYVDCDGTAGWVSVDDWTAT